MHTCAHTFSKQFLNFGLYISDYILPDYSSQNLFKDIGKNSVQLSIVYFITNALKRKCLVNGTQPGIGLEVYF